MDDDKSTPKYNEDKKTKWNAKISQEDVPKKRLRLLDQILDVDVGMMGDNTLCTIGRGPTSRNVLTAKVIDEPTSSHTLNSRILHNQSDLELIASLQSQLAGVRNQLADMKSKNSSLLRDLREAVECPVCMSTPRTPPVPCCRNGHIICKRCKPKCTNADGLYCPICRTTKIDCVSRVANVVIQKVEHHCEFRDEGCEFTGGLGEMGDHEDQCPYRLVRCPHWACNETVTCRNLTHHVIAAECGDSYRDKPLPYQEEMVYTQALDDEDGNGFWKPSLLEFDGHTFYLQVEKCGKSKNWYFYIQLEGSWRDCDRYGTMIKVSKSLDCDRHSVTYNGTVCSVDVKGAAEVEASGAGLNIRNSAMEKIFDVNMERDDLDGSESNSNRDSKGFKFWVEVQIYKTKEESK